MPYLVSSFSVPWRQARAPALGISQLWWSLFLMLLQCSLCIALSVPLSRVTQLQPIRCKKSLFKYVAFCLPLYPQAHCRKVQTLSWHRKFSEQMAPREDVGSVLPIHFHFYLKISGKTKHAKIITASHICVFLTLLYHSDKHVPNGCWVAFKRGTMSFIPKSMFINPEKAILLYNENAFLPTVE